MAETAPEQALQINSQYIKDLSFENPNAPDIYAALGQTPPQLTVNMEVHSAPLRDRTYEIVLAFRVQAVSGDTQAFLIELDYGGLVTLGASVPDADADRLLLIEAPRHLFPFARSTLADVTRDGGFPPLVINPIDFEAYYERRRTASAEAASAQP